MPLRAARPGELQWAILEVLWSEGELSAAGVRDHLGRDRDLALTTVATVLQRMDRAGLVRHRVDGRTHLFRAKATRRDLARSSVMTLVDRVFGGDPATLVSHVLDEHRLTRAELAKVRAVIEAHAPSARKTKS